MPEMRFEIEWPDGKREVCYSPSSIIKDYFEAGISYTVDDFVARSRESLTIASDRVAEKYGFSCSRALGQLAKIEDMAGHFVGVGGEIVVVSCNEL